jgi:hypothetical protein
MTVGTLFSKKSVFLAAGGAVAASAIFAISNVLASSGQLPPASVISITSKQISMVHIDRGQRGRSAGDVDIGRALLYDKRKRVIGHAEMICTATGARSSDCNGTFFLPKGKIVVQGPRSFPELFQVAVVGGTGLFDNVRGTLTITSLGNKPPRQLVYFRLLG